MAENITEKVRDIIVEQLGVNPEQVTQEAKFIEDLGADSLDTVELIMEFEKEFNIAIPDDHDVFQGNLWALQFQNRIDIDLLLNDLAQIKSRRLQNLQALLHLRADS